MWGMDTLLYCMALFFGGLFILKMIWMVWVVFSGRYDDRGFDDDMPTSGWG